MWPVPLVHADEGDLAKWKIRLVQKALTTVLAVVVPRAGPRHATPADLAAPVPAVGASVQGLVAVLRVVVAVAARAAPPAPLIATAATTSATVVAAATTGRRIGRVAFDLVVVAVLDTLRHVSPRVVDAALRVHHCRLRGL